MKKLIEIKTFEKKYQQDLKTMMAQFYSSDAVMHTVDPKYFDLTINLLLQKTPFQQCFVCTYDDNVVGYALIAITYSNEAGGMVAWLDELFIDSAKRGQGIGKLFLSFMQQEYKDFGRFRLEVEDDNERAKSLYRSFGYEMLPYQQMYRELK